MRKLILLLLIVSLSPWVMAAGDNFLLYASDGTTSINGTDVCVDIFGTPSCLSDAVAGAGINTIVAGSGLFGGGSGSTVTLNVSAATCGGTNVSSYNGSGFDCVAQTGGGGGEGKAGDGIYLFNDTTTMFFNDTHAGINLAVNSSDNWDDFNTANSTWFQDIAGVLSLRLSELTSFINAWFAPENATIARTGNCPEGQFVQNATTGGVECAATAGSGDITSVQGDDIYIYNGSDSGDVKLAFNETKLNLTGDERYVNIDGDTMAGELNMNNNNVTNILRTVYNITGCDESSIEGTVCWNSDKMTLNIVTGLGNVIQVGQELTGVGKNLEGSTIFDGQVVTLSGSVGEQPTVVLADASNSSRILNPAVVTIPSCNNNAMCPITTFGFVGDFNTSGWVEGDKLYLSADGSGDLTSISPSFPNYIIFIATVIRVHESTGIILVLPTIDWGNGVTINSLGIINNLTVNGNISASYFVGDGSLLTGISEGNSSFNQSLTDGEYLKRIGDQIDIQQYLLNFTFSNTSLPFTENVASFQVRQINKSGAGVISMQNDVGTAVSMFASGSNFSSALGLDNAVGLAATGADLILAVREPEKSIVMQTINGTGSIVDSLIIENDGDVLLQGRLSFEDDNKSIYSGAVNGGSGLFFLANETLSAGQTPFIWIARNATGSEIRPLILQNGKNNSGGFWRNSEIIGGDLGNSDEQNLTNCLFMANLWGIPIRIACDTKDTGSDVLVQDDIQLGGTVFAEEGIRAEEIADFIMNGNDMNIFNGSIHPATPTTFEQGFSEGESVTVFTSEFSGNINPFVNIQSDSSNWQAVSDASCNNGQCANSNGISGNGDIIMQTNQSTSDVNETVLSFVYSLVGLVGGDDFVVTVNNNTGSGDVEILSDAGTENLISVNIALPASMDDVSILTINFDCGATAANRDCFVDDIKLNGTASDTTLINISGFDSVINMGDGTLAADGYPERGMFYHAENDTIIIRGDVVQTIISEQDLNVTTSITLRGETINFWANITQFVTNMLLTDGSRSLTANWAQGAFNFTNTNSWFLGKVDWSTIQNKFSGSTTDDLSEGSTNLYDNQTWNQSGAALLFADISIDGTVTSVAAGDGLDFSTITSTGSVTMGTPGTLNGGTSNSLSATSHLHAVTTDDTGACGGGNICGGGHEHPASEVTTGTFGTGSYVMDTNLTVEKLVFENSATHFMEDNSTCVKIYGSTSILEIC